MPRSGDWIVHVVPAGEEHTTTGFVCWCCPELHDSEAPDEAPLSFAAAEALLVRDGEVLVVHRSEVPERNDVTGPVPWQRGAR